MLTFFAFIGHLLKNIYINVYLRKNIKETLMSSFAVYLCSERLQRRKKQYDEGAQQNGATNLTAMEGQ